MSTSASQFAARVATLKDIGRKMQALLRRRPLRSAKAPAIYMPAPSPFASETPEERRARHRRIASSQPSLVLDLANPVWQVFLARLFG